MTIYGIPISFLFFGLIWVFFLLLIGLNWLVLIPQLFFHTPFTNKPLEEYWNSFISKRFKKKIWRISSNIFLITVMGVIQWYWLILFYHLIWIDLRGWYWTNLGSFFGW